MACEDKSITVISQKLGRQMPVIESKLVVDKDSLAKDASILVALQPRKEDGGA